MPWTSLCDIDELKEGIGKYVEIDGFQLAVFRHGGKFFALDNCCPHAGGDLAHGYIDEGCAVCPWHFWSFRLEDGELKDRPGFHVGTYPTRSFSPSDGRPAVLQADLPMY